MRDEVYTKVIGDEYNAKLQEALLEALRTLGFRQVGKKEFLVGSQDFSGLTCKRGDDIIEVESETYVGLSISGDKSVVDEIISAIK